MIGKTISHYKIIEKLGEGGMGVVYKAQDTTLDRFVAIKFLPPHLSKDKEATKRFIHEAKAASALDHANIGTIHEVDKTSDGQTFIVMAHYEGETLRQRIDRGEVTVEEAITITSQVAAGLAKAHEKGIVHRDIKPSNIIITSDGEAKIIDFGLAKLADKTRLTKEGITIGTIAYMSPEQAKGEEVDHRSDIFSLGAVFYELLTGEPPFKGEHEAAVLYEIVHEEPEPLSAQRSDVPQEIQQVIDKALAKNTEERYQSAREIMDKLEELREYSSTRAGAPGRYRRKDTNKRKMYVMGVVAVVIIVAAVAVFLFSRYRAPIPAEETRLAVVDFSNLADSEEHTLSVGISGLIHTGLVESSPCQVVSQTLLQDIRRRLFGVIRGPIEESQALAVAREAGAAMLITGQIMPGTNAYVAWDLTDIRSGKSLAARRLEGGELIVLADQIVADVLPLLAEQCGVKTSISPRSVSEMTTVSPQAYQNFMAGVMARDEQRYANAIRYFEQALEYDSTFALALFRLSEAHFESGERGQLVRDYADRAWELRSHLGMKESMRLKAWRQRMKWNFQDALATYREMLKRWPDDQEVIRELTSLLYYFRFFDEAGDIAREGFKLYPDDQIIAGFGWPSLALSGHMEEAIASIRKYLERHPRSVRGWEELGWRYLETGKTDSAEAAFHQVLEIDPTFLEAQRGIGSCYYQRGNLNKAVDTFEQILRRSDLLPSVRVVLLTSIRQGVCFSWLYAEKGCFEKALEFFEEARQLVTDPERDARLERERGWLLLRVKRADEVLLAARNLAKRTESTYAPTVALEISARAFVVLDSLETAEHIVAELGSIRGWWGAYQGLLSHKITAEIALARGNSEKALVSLKEMERQAAFGLGLIDIEYWEDLARSYRMAGQLDKATEALRELLRLYGGHAIAHYELGQLYEEMKRTEDAKQEYEKFLEMWSEADEGLPQVEDAKRRLAALGKQNM